MSNEWFEVIDAQGHVIGRALRHVCHGHPGLTHRAVHVVVVNRNGEIFLQKRSMHKDVQPGKWDTSVGGHLQPGESIIDGARRELREELGVGSAELSPAYEYFWRSKLETERISAFILRHEGPFQLDPHEISDGRFWTVGEIDRNLSGDLFTEQFTHEFPRMSAFLRQAGLRHG